MRELFVYQGGPCTCRPGRYVRYVIPHNVPGCKAMISCRANGAKDKEIEQHPLPREAVVLIHTPSVSTR